MRYLVKRATAAIALVTTAVIFNASLASVASAQSVWQKMKTAAKQQACKSGDQKACQELQQQSPGQQQPGQPGQQPPKPGQPPKQSGQVQDDSGSLTPPHGTKIEEAVLAAIEPGTQMQFAVSPLGIHTATLSHSGSRQVITYDGVPGPKFDRIFLQNNNTGVVFSADGKRYGYCGVVGNEWVVMVDGNELLRSSDSHQGQIDDVSCGGLNFTSNSKHVYFTSNVDQKSRQNGQIIQVTRFIFDGKVAPGYATTNRSSFSPDGEHYAYYWVDGDNPAPPCVRDNHCPSGLIVDGKITSIPGSNPQWTADSKHLLTTRTGGGPQGPFWETFVNGKPYIRAYQVQFAIPPVGDMVVAIVTEQVGANGSRHYEQFLVIEGKKVPGSELSQQAGGSISNIVFSPDGRHYAATYLTTPGQGYVFSDGKKGPQYSSGVGKLTFAADSSRMVYLGGGGGHVYVVQGDEESQQWFNNFAVVDIVIPPAGPHVAAVAVRKGIILDNKFIPSISPQQFTSTKFGFSPDGNHYAYVDVDAQGKHVVVDGVMQSAYTAMYAATPADSPSAGNSPLQLPFVWSPDSKHFAYFCSHSDPAASTMGVCLDGKFLWPGPNARPGNLTFAPDGNHLLWWKQGSVFNSFRLYADGKPVLDGKVAINSAASFPKETWQMSDDGTLLLLEQDGVSMKRVTIQPSSESSLATILGGNTVASGR